MSTGSEGSEDEIESMEGSEDDDDEDEDEEITCKQNCTPATPNIHTPVPHFSLPPPPPH
jgi:hypothetical protein